MGGVALSVFLLAAIFPLSLADVDLSADSIEIESGASADRVTATAGVIVFEQTADYDFTITLEQWRNGQLISTSTATFNADVSQSTLCDESCRVTRCESGCQLHYSGGIVFGLCRDQFECPNRSGYQVCGCAHAVNLDDLVVLQTGDVLRMSVDPGPTTVDPNPSNNMTEVTVP